jgi:nitroreductase
VQEIRSGEEDYGNGSEHDSGGCAAVPFLIRNGSLEISGTAIAGWNQPQVTDSSHVIAILARPAQVAPGHLYVAEIFGRRGLPEDATNAYIEKYRHHMETEVLPRMSLYAWCSKQCYIALADIMTAAAAMGIDSCPMEGFEKDWVERILEIDTRKEEVVVLVALGYRAGKQPPRRRHPMETLVEIR